MTMHSGVMNSHRKPRSVILGILMAMLILLPLELRGWYSTEGVMAKLNAGLFLVVLLLIGVFGRGMTGKTSFAAGAGVLAFVDLALAWAFSCIWFSMMEAVQEVQQLGPSNSGYRPYSNSSFPSHRGWLELWPRS